MPLSQLPGASGIAWLVDGTCLHIIFPLYVSASVQISPYYKDTHLIDEGPL